LLQTTRAKAEAEFEGDLGLTYHLAPPMMSKTGADGRPMKKAYGEGFARWFGMLARMKRLRGTPLDVFGYTTERRMERRLLKQYEADLKVILPKVTSETLDIAVALAELPLQIRGFGPVKDQNAKAAALRRDELLTGFHAGGSANTPLKAAAE
jgi:indolepyruvate ferredoxin oxidoreductase